MVLMPAGNGEVSVGCKSGDRAGVGGLGGTAHMSMSIQPDVDCHTSEDQSVCCGEV